MIVFANDNDGDSVDVVVVVVNDYRQCSCVSPIIIDNDDSCRRCLLLLLNFFCRSSSRCLSQLILSYLHLTLLLYVALWNSMSIKLSSSSSFAQALTIPSENMVQLHDIIKVPCEIPVQCPVLGIT